MKKLIALLAIITLSGCGTTTSQNNTYSPSSYKTETQTHHANYVTIKYRNDEVDVANPIFEELNTSKSSWIRGAWYDDSNVYMVINLQGTYYHYCGLTQSTWNSFRKASSFGSHYNKYLKGNYDCRINYVPQY